MRITSADPFEHEPHRANQAVSAPQRPRQLHHRKIPLGRAEHGAEQPSGAFTSRWRLPAKAKHEAVTLVAGHRDLLCLGAERTQRRAGPSVPSLEAPLAEQGRHGVGLVERRHLDNHGMTLR
jgi:hypothetical protein